MAIVRGLRDFGLFCLVAIGVFLVYTVVTTAAEGEEQNLGLALTFGPGIALAGAFVSIPGLVVHRLLVRRLERRGAASRGSVILLSPVITLAGIWWLALVARDAEQGLAAAGTSAALVTVTALIYGAIVPRRGMPPPPPPMPVPPRPGPS
ncbi:MAG: hypothetical protein WD770_00715 [Actinomycetota bacterium]